MAPRAAVAVAIVGALPAGFLAMAMLVSGIGDYLDPCHRWDAQPGEQVTVEASGPCASSSATSHTRLSYAGLLVAVAGGLLAGVSLAATGVARNAPGMALAGVGLLVGELGAMLLGLYYAGVLAYATLASLGILLWALRSGADLARWHRWVVCGVGLVAGAGFVAVVVSGVRAALLEGAPVYLGLVLFPALLLGVALAALAPPGERSRWQGTPRR